MNFNIKRIIVVLLNVSWVLSFLYALTKTYMMYEDIHIFMVGPIYMLVLAPAVTIVFEMLCYFIHPLQSMEERKEYKKLCLYLTGTIYAIYAYIYVCAYVL